MKPYTPPNGLEPDRFLEIVLGGATARETAFKLKRTEPEIKAWARKLFFDPAYRPAGPRIWRGGTRFLPLERKLIRAWSRRSFPPVTAGLLLQRKPSELFPDERGRDKIRRMQEVAPGFDILLAHHYLYWSCKKPVISNEVYDAAKAEEIEFGAADLLRFLDGKPKQVIDYPAHIRSLAHYILYKDMELNNRVDFDHLPLYFAPDGYWKKKGKGG